MTTKTTQRHTGASTPAAHHRVPVENDTTSQKKQVQWIISIAANLLCLIAAGMYVWVTHDLIGFLILYGVATQTLSVREVIGASFLKRPSQSTQTEQEDQNVNNETSTENSINL